MTCSLIALSRSNDVVEKTSVTESGKLAVNGEKNIFPITRGNLKKKTSLFFFLQFLWKGGIF